MIELPFLEVVRFDHRERDLKAIGLGGSREKICDLFEGGKDVGWAVEKGRRANVQRPFISPPTNPPLSPLPPPPPSPPPRFPLPLAKFGGQRPGQRWATFAVTLSTFISPTVVPEGDAGGKYGEAALPNLC